MFYDKFVKLCAKYGKKPADISKELGISKSTISCWKSRNAAPTDANLQKLANYFDVSPEYLMDTEQKEKPAGDGELSADQKETIEKIKNMSPEELARKMAALRAVLEME